MSRIFVPLKPEAELLVKGYEDRIAALEASHRELVEALKEAKGWMTKPSAFFGGSEFTTCEFAHNQVDNALANAEKINK